MWKQVFMSTWLDNNDAGLANVFVSSMPTWGNGSPSLWRTCLHVDNDHCLQRRGTSNVDTALSCKRTMCPAWWPAVDLPPPSCFTTHRWVVQPCRWRREDARYASIFSLCTQGTRLHALLYLVLAPGLPDLCLCTRGWYPEVLHMV